MKPSLLIIDDDNEYVGDLLLLLKHEFECSSVERETEAIKIIKENPPDAILLDLMLGDGVSGIDVLNNIRAVDDSIPIIMMTDYASVETAVLAIRLGAFDYISKTPNLNELKILIEKSLQQRLLKYQTESLIEELNKPFLKIVGNSFQIEKVKEKIKLFSQTDHTVLITGESGVGKELVARQIHFQSNRSKKPFVAINCGALPKDLVESELFGNERGAFTGADKRRLGKFEIAEGGTIFLDEISELEPLAQVKLLRVLQEKEFQRIGGSKTLKADVKIIAATNKNLHSLVLNGIFREDLYYRLEVLPIHVPTLRERNEDIPLLIKYFSYQIASELNKPEKIFSDQLISQLKSYHWPGNIRELRNYIYRIYLLSDAKLIESDNSNFANFNTSHESEKSFEIPTTWEKMNTMRKKASLEAARKVEKVFLDFLLNKFNGNITKAAEYAGISRTNLHKMLSKMEH